MASGYAAGIWEENPELGPCYTMVTTAASPLMLPIHGRMPALLRPEEMQEWLAGKGRWDFQPFTGPLAKRRDGGTQQELF